jgi:NADH:ubiquinone oxidoreductase subunit 5 (subunit L)/multisubunit Na+/H+ antiporter MnhA subunit
MGYPSFDPETALVLVHAMLYSMAWILAGAALIAFSIYVVLVCSEMFFSQPRSKTQRAKARHSARPVPVAKENLDLSAVETPVLAATERLGEEAERATASPHSAQIPMTVPPTLESESTWT